MKRRPLLLAPLAMLGVAAPRPGIFEWARSLLARKRCTVVLPFEPSGEFTVTMPNGDSATSSDGIRWTLKRIGRAFVYPAIGT